MLFMKIRSKLFLNTGIVFLTLLIICSLFIWALYEITELKKTRDDGVKLITECRYIHGLMKDIVYDTFSPQMYNMLKDIVYVPRTNIAFKNWNIAVDDFEKSLVIFMNTDRVKHLLRDAELKDKYDAANKISSKAFKKINSLTKSFNELEKSGILGKEGLYLQIQTSTDPSLIKLFEELRSTSYYFTNTFETFLNYFVNSLHEESLILQRQILLTLWILIIFIGSFITIFTLTFSNKIAKRIKTIESAMQKVSEGDFTAELNINTKDEFGILSRNLNIFIKNLQKNVDSVLNLMKDVGLAITEKFNLVNILELSVELIIKYTNADGAAVLLFDEYNNNLSFKTISGIFPPFFKIPKKEISLLDDINKIKSYMESKSIKIEKSILKKIIKTKESISFKNTAENDVIIQNFYEDYFIKSFFAVPIKISKRLFGIISIVKINNGSLTDLDFTHLMTFADYAALTIDNFLKYTELLEKKEAEFQALQAQIQPHFLYNFLNGLIGLNRLGDRKSLEKAIFSLQEMLRYILEHGEWSTIKEEFIFLQKYCELQKIRFQEYFNYSIICEENVEKYKVPKLILQPLVENSIIHGIEPLGKEGKLEVFAKLENNSSNSSLVINITDNGVGYNKNKVKTNDHIGIANVRERLSIAFVKSSFEIKSKIGSGTKITIKISEKELIR